MTSVEPSVRDSATDGALFALVLLDTVLLAALELFFLPLRFDGVVLPAWGGAPFPVTVLLALVTTPLLVTSAARLVRPRLAMLPLVLWVVTLLVLGVLGPGGDQVLIEDWRMLLLLLCGALPTAAVVGRTLGMAQPSSQGRAGDSKRRGR